ncbi:glycosyl transferase [Paenibacillus montaniterrae]|uniref:Glycosyl transferase n=1 Tax=Paenibacillus montaniterrae TaxID=429341 RepID=A0A919YN34_9BACL|nr:glycosyltransferase family 4 protein [Paenibacillus montaniterrae]GIP16500.1 glycosyl transferase [Paenibacillus montaniterrae]
MKIAIVINSDVGLYKFRKELIEKLMENNQVIILTPLGQYCSYFKSIGCIIYYSEINRRSVKIKGEFELLKEYYQVLQKERPEIVLTYTIKPNIYIGLLAKMLKIPVISTVTGLGTFIIGQSIQKRLARKIYSIIVSQSKVVFFQNKQNYDLFNIKNKQLIAGSGVNLNEYPYLEYPGDDKNIHFLFVGRLMQDKGIIELCSVARYLVEKYEHIIFHIVGEKEDDFQFDRKEYQIENKIIFYGNQTNVIPFYRNCHAIIHPSYHEGLSNVLLEAAACGRPILASNIPGCMEIFDEGISGFSFPKQSVKGLESAIEKFIQLSWKEREKMGIFAREKVSKEFNRELIINRYIDAITN